MRSGKEGFLVTIYGVGVGILSLGEAWSPKVAGCGSPSSRVVGRFKLADHEGYQICVLSASIDNEQHYVRFLYDKWFTQSG